MALHERYNVSSFNFCRCRVNVVLETATMPRATVDDEKASSKHKQAIAYPDYVPEETKLLRSVVPG